MPVCFFSRRQERPFQNRNPINAWRGIPRSALYMEQKTAILAPILDGTGSFFAGWTLSIDAHHLVFFLIFIRAFSAARAKNRAERCIFEVIYNVSKVAGECAR